MAVISFSQRNRYKLPAYMNAHRDYGYHSFGERVVLRLKTWRRKFRLWQIRREVRRRLARRIGA